MTPASQLSSQIRSLEDLYGPAGRLEALLNEGAAVPPFITGSASATVTVTWLGS